MVTIDGAAGGGQVLRSALSLAVIKERSVTIESVRGSRDTPGLRPQHLAGLSVLAELTDAEVEGDAIGAETVSFDPQVPPAGDVEIDIGTAGAISLLVEPILSLGPVIDEPVTVRATGGTDVKWSPTVDYLVAVRSQALADHGWPVEIEVATRGYYPVGGGTAAVTVEPADPHPLSLAAPAHVEGAIVYSHASETLRTADVAERQVEGATEALAAADVSVTESTVAYHDVPSTGTSITVVAEATDGYLGGDAIGERGRPAEDVGEAAARDLLEASATSGAVDHHLADQLLIPLAVGGGHLHVPDLTDHVETNLSVIEAFGYDLSVEEHADETATISA